MRRLLLIVAVSACTRSTPDKVAPTPDPDVAITRTPPPITDAAVVVDPALAVLPRVIPPGPYVIRYDCFHSNQPFGKGSQYRNASYDLGAGTSTYLAWEDKGLDEPRPLTVEPVSRRPGKGKQAREAADARPTPQVTTLSPGFVTHLAAALDTFLHGGPYRRELPPSEGTPCTLGVSAGGTEFFQMEKAFTEQPDAASALIVALRYTGP